MTALILLSEFRKTEIELWRHIEGFLGYEVSNLGRVRSFWRKSGSGRSFVNGQVRGSWTYVLDKTTPFYLKGSLDKDGYRAFALSRRGEKVKLTRAHRIGCPSLYRQLAS